MSSETPVEEEHLRHFLGGQGKKCTERGRKKEMGASVRNVPSRAADT